MRADERATLRAALARGADGDRAALEEAFACARPLVLAVCQRVLGDDQAEDAAQEAMVNLFFHLSSYDEARDPVPWVAAFAVNASRTALKRRIRRREQPHPPERAAEGDPEQAAIEADLRAAVRATLGALSELDAETLSLAMGERPNTPTFRKRLERAMRRFRALWSPR